jgi:hypothetical protein
VGNLIHVSLLFYSRRSLGRRSARPSDESGDIVHEAAAGIQFHWSVRIPVHIEAETSIERCVSVDRLSELGLYLCLKSLLLQIF